GVPRVPQNAVFDLKVVDGCRRDRQRLHQPEAGFEADEPLAGELDLREGDLSGSTLSDNPLPQPFSRVAKMRRPLPRARRILSAPAYAMRHCRTPALADAPY